MSDEAELNGAQRAGAIKILRKFSRDDFDNVLINENVNLGLPAVWDDETYLTRALLKLNNSGKISSVLISFAAKEMRDSDRRFLLQLAKGQNPDSDPLPPPGTIRESELARARQNELERAIRNGDGIQRLDTTIERQRMLQLQVCQVEAAVSGTGFLVAPDLILTNYHVVEQEIKSDRATNVICRFDFTRDLTGEFRGTAMGLASTEWCVAYSPYAPADVSGGGRLPNANELDYALLRLAGAPQVLPPMPGQVGRGHVFVSASAAVPAEGRDIKVIQHPERMPQCIGVGKAIGLADGGLRFRYTAETREGSSGSPVFDAEFSLVALHHAGQPGSKLTPGDFNQGIPISKIVLDLRSKCVDKFWE